MGGGEIRGTRGGGVYRVYYGMDEGAMEGSRNRKGFSSLINQNMLSSIKWSN